MDVIGLFLESLRGILALDSDVIRGVQSMPSGPVVAVTILLLACVSDVLGNSPLLFIRRMRPARLATSLGIATILTVVRLSIWVLSFWVVVSVLEGRSVPLARVVLVIGIGYAPMLLSALTLIPTVGPFIGRLLEAWTLVAITSSIAVARALSPWEALVTGLLTVLTVLLLQRTSDRLIVAVLSWLSRRLLGVDVMQRTRAIDPRRIAAAVRDWP